MTASTRNHGVCTNGRYVVACQPCLIRISLGVVVLTETIASTCLCDAIRPVRTPLGQVRLGSPSDRHLRTVSILLFLACEKSSAIDGSSATDADKVRSYLTRVMKHGMFYSMHNFNGTLLPARTKMSMRNTEFRKVSS